MGWTTTRNYPNQTPRDFINIHVLSTETLVALEVDDTTIYVAYKADSDVSALVVLREFEDDLVAYKVLEETEGPFEAHASQAFLDVLSPTDNEFATEWRSQCRAKAGV